MHHWECYSAFYAALKHCLYGAFGFFSHILPPFIRTYLFTREKPHDLEACGRPLSKNDSPTIAKDHSLGSAEEDKAVIPGEIVDPVLYEPPLKEILSQGSTSLIARVRLGVVVKCPRYSWWHSEAAETHSFVKDIKRSFEVEERLLDILGMHPRLIRCVRPNSTSSMC